MDLRVANMEDVPAMNALIAASARELSIGFYSPPQIEALLTHVFGVDTQLLADGTYYIVDAMEAPGGPAAAGGWSGRRTMRRDCDYSTCIRSSVSAPAIISFSISPTLTRAWVGFPTINLLRLQQKPGLWGWSCFYGCCLDFCDS